MKKIEKFNQEMQQIKKRRFKHIGVGEDYSYTQSRYFREEKKSYHKGSKTVVTPRECDKVVMSTHNPRKEYEEVKRCVQEAFEAVEARKKKIQAAHQSVDIDQKQGSYLDIAENKVEQAKVSEQLNKVVSNSSHDMITHLSCPKEAEKGIGNVEERSATRRSVTFQDNEMEQSSPELQVSPDSTSKEMDLTTT